MNTTTTFDLETLLAESEIETPVNLLDDDAQDVDTEEATEEDGLDEVADDEEEESAEAAEDEAEA